MAKLLQLPTPISPSDGGWKVRGLSEYLLFTFCLSSWLGPEKQYCWPKINCSQMKLPNFVNPSADSLSKIGHHFNDKVVQSIKVTNKNFLQNKNTRKI